MKEIKATIPSLLKIMAQLLLPEVPAAFHSNGPSWAKYVFPSPPLFPLHLAVPIQRASDQGGSDPYYDIVRGGKWHKKCVCCVKAGIVTMSLELNSLKFSLSPCLTMKAPQRPLTF